MKTNVFLKRLTLGALPAALGLSAFAQTANFAYEFTVGPGFTLSNIFIVDAVPSSMFSTVAAVSTNGQTFGPGSQIAGVISGTTYGANYLTLMAVFTNATATNVAISLPQSLAASLIPNGSWTNFDNSANFPFGRLPDEPTTLSDLQSASLGTLSSITYMSFSYLQSSSPVLQGAGTAGTIVAFDGAQSAGSFSFVPQPTLSVTPGAGAVTIQWPTNSPGFTLAQTTNLALGLWSNVTNVPAISGANYSVTLPLHPTSTFFRLHLP
jgi:hypothetical protein